MSAEFLPGLADVRDLDQLEGSLVQPALERLVAVEIAIGLLDHDVALEQQALEHFPDVERGKLGLEGADGDVFQVEEDGHRGVGIGSAHQIVHVSEITGVRQRKFSLVSVQTGPEGGTGAADLPGMQLTQPPLRTVFFPKNHLTEASPATDQTLRIPDDELRRRRDQCLRCDPRHRPCRSRKRAELRKSGAGPHRERLCRELPETGTSPYEAQHLPETDAARERGRCQAVKVRLSLLRAHLDAISRDHAHAA